MPSKIFVDGARGPACQAQDAGNRLI